MPAEQQLLYLRAKVYLTEAKYQQALTGTYGGQVPTGTHGGAVQHLQKRGGQAGGDKGGKSKVKPKKHTKTNAMQIDVRKSTQSA